MKHRSALLGSAAALVAALGAAAPAVSAPVAVVLPAHVALAPVAASADRPDTLAAARLARAEPLDTWLRETLPAGDVDWFHVRGTSSSKVVSVTLGGLPADYDLAVFGADGRQRATSTRTGRTFDEVWVREPGDELFVRVVRKRGAAAGSYSLRLRQITRDVQLLSAFKSFKYRGAVFGEFYNATGQWGAVSELDVEWLDRKGRVLRRYETYMSPQAWVRPWSRFPFATADQITAAQDDRSVRVRAEVKVNFQTADPKEPALKAHLTKVHTWPPDAGNTGGRTYEGTVTN
ncbi:MAG TPA: hypothetical protein VE781_06110, partial [Kineosporiaceae bacterium]|nr:hypothetical protein [Kineosporiaceae bacterium]